jgi:lupus La protein
LGKVGGSKNNPVELSILHSFKRMRHFQPFEAIVNAMRESTFLELCEDDKCVRRKDPLPAELDDGPDPNAIQIFEDRAMPRSIYAKGFGEETPSTQFDIEAFFAEFGTTNAVRLRRHDDKTFKGSVFVEFDNEETAQKFLEKDPKPEYKGKALQIMSKKEYCEKKVDDIKAGRTKRNDRNDKGGRYSDRRGGGRDGRDRRKRDDEDDRDWRVRRDEDRKNGFGDKRKGRGDRDSKGKYEKAEKDDRYVLCPHTYVLVTNILVAVSQLSRRLRTTMVARRRLWPRPRLWWRPRTRRMLSRLAPSVLVRTTRAMPSARPRRLTRRRLRPLRKKVLT